MKDQVAARSSAQGFLTSRLPEFTQEEIVSIRGSFDFFGLNHYTSGIVQQGNQGPPGSPSYWDDRNIDGWQDPTWPGSASEWLKVVPWGFTKLLGWIRTTYGNPEVIIFENGFSDRGGLDDGDRVNYYHLYLNAMLDAIDEGSDVTAYTAWSLMDNFEWLRGYTSVLM
jgi:beta-glucosidase/6-phospho-beta-glucosidase/beta-galactosidase